jgi:hypothetical protein
LRGSDLNNAVAVPPQPTGGGVQVPRKFFFGHGYCAADTWFVGAIQAKINQNVNGAFHPTEARMRRPSKVAASGCANSPLDPDITPVAAPSTL